MEICEVLVVGGGPAGSTCARHLTTAGVDVVVLDKQDFPRDKVCAGWITPAVAAELALDIDVYRQTNVLQPIDSFCTGLLGGPEIITNYGATVSYGIRRCEFDDYLLRQSGARLALGEPLRSMVRQDGQWLVNDRIRAALVVGAGGHFCPVAQVLGANPGSAEAVVAAQEIEFRMSPEQCAACRVSGSRPELFFCADLEGYGWCFRKGDFLNIGLGREDSHRLGQHLDEFIGALIGLGKIPADTPRRGKGHAYLLYSHSRRTIISDGVLLIGDAAGLAYPQSGEGIRPAVESGLMAAETILAAAGDYRTDALADYPLRLMHRFGRRATRQQSPPRLPLRFKQRLAALLLASSWFTRHVMLDRWFLHRRQSVLDCGTRH